MTKQIWVHTTKSIPKNPSSMYWVLNLDGKVRMCHLNDYTVFGGEKICWQTLGGNDFSFEGTMYIECKKPEYKAVFDENLSIKVLTLIERTIAGMEWNKDKNKELWSGADDDHLKELKEFLQELNYG